MQHLVNIFTAFRARPFAGLLLLYTFLFFNVIVPGHQRGAITLDGKHSIDTASCCCCCHDNSAAAKSDSKHAPSQHDKAECAICHLAARILPIQVLCIVLPELGLLETVPLDRPSAPVTADLLQTYQSRGPPWLYL
jgi:hypothetical protein